MEEVYRPTRGLSVESIRKNKRETILTLAPADRYNISWLQLQLNRRLNIQTERKEIK